MDNVIPETKGVKSDTTVLTEIKRKKQFNARIGYGRIWTDMVSAILAKNNDERVRSRQSILLRKELKRNLNSWDDINAWIWKVQYLERVT